MSPTERLVLFIFVGVFSVLQAFCGAVFAYRLKLNLLVWSVISAIPVLGIFALTMMLGPQVESLEKASSDSEKSFQKASLDYRLRIFQLIAGLLVWLVLAGYLTNLSLLPKLVFGILWLGGGAVIIGTLGPRLPDCPNCQRNLTDLFGGYCPECLGALSSGSTQFEAHCTACGKTLRNVRKGNNFRIHGCSHCGVLLDRSGLP